MSKYLITIQCYENNCIGIAVGETPDEAIQNFVEECITLSYNEFKGRQNGDLISYKSGYDLPCFVESEETFNKGSISELAKEYIKAIDEETSSTSATAYEIPEDMGKAVVAVNIYGRYTRYTTATNGKITE